MKKLLIITCILGFGSIAFTQEEDVLWYIGTLEGGTTQGGVIDFTTDPIGFYGGDYKALAFEQPEGTASCADEDGNLLFYTDGVDVWGTNHEIMPNGSGLGGHRSTMYSAAIVPNPANEEQFYLFSNDGHTTSVGTGIHYSLVDMTLNAGNGDVIPTEKAVPLQANTCEVMTVSKNSNCKDFWVITLSYPEESGSDDLHVYAFPVNEDGVGTPVVSNLGAFGGLSLVDQLKVSPIGDKAVMRIQSAAIWENVLLNFSQETGVFTVESTFHEGFGPMRGDFSPNGQLYYCTFDGNLVQYSVTDMLAASVTVASGVGDFQDYKIGPDNKLYTVQWGQINVIHNPDTPGIGCDFEAEVVPNPGFMGGPFLFPNLYLTHSLSSDLDLGEDALLPCGEELVLAVTAEGDITWSTGATTPEITVTESGEYWVEVDNGGCLHTDTIEVTVDGELSVDLGNDTVLCGEQLVLNSDLPLTAGDHLWSTDETTESITVTSTGTYWLKVSSETCGDASDTIHIELVTPVIADFLYSPEEIFVGEDVFFTDYSSGDPTVWDWRANGTGFSTDENPVSSFNPAGNNTIVQIVSNEHCSDTAIQTISVLPFEEERDELLYFVPNAFTPDGDGYNNTFKPVFTSGFDPYGYHLSIFNRWGEVLFESYNSEVGWSGIYAGGNLVQDGVYLWVIEFSDQYTDEVFSYSGHVIVIK